MEGEIMSENELQTIEAKPLMRNKSVPLSAEIEFVRAAQEVNVRVLVARQNPRDLAKIRDRILEELKNVTVAEKCLYKVNRGANTIEGGGIRLAELIARNYENLQTMFVEHRQTKELTELEAVCWDMECNNHHTDRFTVKHERYTKEFTKSLTDPTSIREAVAAVASRKMRNCIFKVVPQSLVQDALETCRQTVARSMVNAIKRQNMIDDFEEKFNVNTEKLQEYIGKRIVNFTDEDFVELKTVFVTLSEGDAKPDDYFAPKFKIPEQKSTKKVQSGKQESAKTLTPESEPPAKQAETNESIKEEETKPAEKPIPELASGQRKKLY
jgi:ribosomal protein S17E